MKIPITLPRQFWFVAFGIALLLALIWVALKSGPLAPIQVTVTQVAKGEVSPALFGIGTVEARRAYLIGPTAAGRVGRVLGDVGDTVQAGQLLAEMDPVDLDARVSSAAAAAAPPPKAGGAAASWAPAGCCGCTLPATSLWLTIPLRPRSTQRRASMAATAWRPGASCTWA